MYVSGIFGQSRFADQVAPLAANDGSSMHWSRSSKVLAVSKSIADCFIATALQSTTSSARLPGLLRSHSQSYRAS